jgi:hypothetical protein
MREAVAPGGQEDEAGAGDNDGPSVGDGLADGLIDAPGVTVAVGLSDALKFGLADGCATTTLAVVGPGVPPPKGDTPSTAVTTTKRARTTSPTPTIDRIERRLRACPLAGLEGVSLARRVPRTYRGQLTWTRWRQTSSC